MPEDKSVPKWTVSPPLPVTSFPKVRRRPLSAKARLGCLPITLLGGTLVIIGLNVAAFSQVPLYISDPRDYLVSGRIGLTLVLLVIFQVGLTWLLGLMAAGDGARAVYVKGSESSLPLRVKQQTRSLASPVAALLIVRLAILSVIGLALVYAFTSIFGSRLYWELTNIARLVLQAQLPLTLITIGLLLVVSFLGPILRIRVSAALGALAGTFGKTAQSAVSQAISARLALGLAGVLTLLWGGSALGLVLTMLNDPVSQAYTGYYGGPLSFPSVNTASWRAMVSYGLGGFALWMILHLAGGVILSGVFTRLASRRLGEAKQEANEAGFPIVEGTDK